MCFRLSLGGVINRKNIIPHAGQIKLHCCPQWMVRGINSTAVVLSLLLIHTYTMSFSNKYVREVQPQLPFLSRLSVGGLIYGIVALVRSINWLREWHQYFFPSDYQPNAIKTYETRSYLPVRYVTPTPFFPGPGIAFKQKLGPTRSNSLK